MLQGETLNETTPKEILKGHQEAYQEEEEVRMEAPAFQLVAA